MFSFKRDDDLCAICLESKKCPIYLICGHSFCELCFKTYMTYEDICNKCPLCRNKLSRKKNHSPKYFPGVLCFILLSLATGYFIFYKLP